jgi:hypothetical protein
MQTTDTPTRDTQKDNWVEPVRNALAGLKFGSVVIIIQDGVAVQIDRTEKLRLDRPAS